LTEGTSSSHSKLFHGAADDVRPNETNCFNLVYEVYAKAYAPCASVPSKLATRVLFELGVMSALGTGNPVFRG